MVTRSVMSPFQHGFMKCPLTTKNMLELTSFVKSFQGNLQADVKCIWRPYANHSLLAHKLKLFGFSPKLLCWIVNYLTDRNWQVLFKNNHFDPIHGTPYSWDFSLRFSSMIFRWTYCSRLVEGQRVE